MSSTMLAALALLMGAMASASVAAFTFRKDALSLEAAFGGLGHAEAFQAWAGRHGRTYPSPAEEQHRQRVFVQNAQRVLQLNTQPDRKLKLGLNGLADMTSEEFRAKMLLPKPMELPEATAAALSNKKPDYFPWRYEHVKPVPAIDWRSAQPPIMGPVRSQHANNASCGCCYAFAAVGIAEASSAITTGEVVPGSEQQLIDCDDKHDHGCDGGDFHNALDYIIYNKGLTTEASWPYLGRGDRCDRKKEKDHQLKIDDWESVPPMNETALMQALTMRPVVSAICCGSNLDDWHHYDGGVFDVPCCADKLSLDHAIVLAGYGTTADGEEYYVLKNSWSDQWGEQGYMRIARNVPGPAPSRWVSQCGLASMPTMVFRGPKPPPPQGGEDQAGASAARLQPQPQGQVEEQVQVQVLREEAQGDLQAWFTSRLPRFMLPHHHRNA